VTAQALPLFGAPDPSLDGSLSAGRRRTLRNHTKITAGRHPATGAPLLRSEDPTQGGVCCGDCSNAWASDAWRCRLSAGRLGQQVVIRISWPACNRFARRPAPAAGIRRGRYPAVTRA
jgi:hypothetical protein